MNIRIQNLTKEFGDLVAVNNISLSIENGEFVTFVGPSGCGKTTSLRCIAGLEHPTSGSIEFNDEEMIGKSPQAREVAFVFQDYALYPHMSARRNMAFALEDTSLSSEEIGQKIDDAAQMLGISDHLDKKPPELSGGQQQRVALGRSIVRDPKLFLMDEPLSNLDAKLRIQMRAEIQQLHQELDTTMIYVTHDQEEAMTMSDRIVVLSEGEIQQIARPEVVYSQPANEFVAGFIGSPTMNFLKSEYQNGLIESEPFSLESPIETHDRDITLGVRPEDLEITSTNEGHTTAKVSVFEQIGSYNIVYLSLAELEDPITAQVPGSVYLEEGEEVGVRVNTDRIHLFGQDGEALYNPQVYSNQEPEQMAKS